MSANPQHQAAPPVHPTPHPPPPRPLPARNLNVTKAAWTRRMRRGGARLARASYDGVDAGTDEQMTERLASFTDDYGIGCSPNSGRGRAPTPCLVLWRVYWLRDGASFAAGVSRALSWAWLRIAVHTWWRVPDPPSADEVVRTMMRFWQACATGDMDIGWNVCAAFAHVGGVGYSHRLCALPGRMVRFWATMR